ncbi:MAG: hypothetical protein M3O67_02110 [Bacteroidota bacterium]|nr:hypothetical protein [Bacteroidota bacterium]
MKKTFYKTGILILIVCSGICSCNKQKNFPGETTEGKNVLGCFINGVSFLPCVDFLQWRIKAQGYPLSPTHYVIGVSARNNCDSKYEYGRSIIISFDSIQIEENKTYKLGRFYDGKKGQVSCLYSVDLKSFTSDSALDGTITVRKFDIQRRILSASFNAILKQRDSTGTASLTQGTFDVMY